MDISKDNVYINMQATIADFAAIKYQTQWQRISQMQQNATILLAIITFSITLLFQITGIEKHGKLILDDIPWNDIVLSGIFSSLIIGIISSIFLFKVIMPKTIENDLPLPGDIFKELHIAVEKNVVKDIPDKPGFYEYSTVHPFRYMADAIVKRYSQAIDEINTVVEKKPKKL